MPDFDLSQFATAAVSGTPLLFVVFVIVEIVKRLKNKAGEQLVNGNGLLLSSFMAGLVIGLGYMLFLGKPPEADWHADYRYWFASAIYGIALGGIAALFFDGVKAIVVSAIERLAGKYVGGQG